MVISTSTGLLGTLKPVSAYTLWTVVELATNLPKTALHELKSERSEFFPTRNDRIGVGRLLAVDYLKKCMPTYPCCTSSYEQPYMYVAKVLTLS
jgi:hypothetical protein